MPPKSKSSSKQDGAIKGNKSKQSKTTAPNHFPVQWPPITALVPVEDLVLTTLLKDQILTISRFWTSSLCKTYVNFLSTLPFSTTPSIPKRGEAVRVNDRYQIDDSEFAELLWSRTALKQIVEHPVIDGKKLDDGEKRRLWDGDVVGLNSNIRIYRYTKGQFFDQHCKLHTYHLRSNCISHAESMKLTVH